MKCVIIDGNNLALIGLSAKLHALEQEGLSIEENWEQGFRKLFMCQIKNVKKLVGSSSALYYAAWDHPTGSQWRKDLLPEYKANRTKRLPFANEALSIAKDIAEELDVSNIEIPDAEGDDVILAFCKVAHKEHDVTVVSRDADMIQIFQKGYAHRIWNPVTKKDQDIPEYDIVLYKSLVGDKSDNISGVNGIGPKKALKMIEAGLSKDEYALVAPYKKLVDLEENPLGRKLYMIIKQKYLDF